MYFEHMAKQQQQQQLSRIEHPVEPCCDAWTMSYIEGHRPDDFRYDKSCTCIDNGMGVLAQVDGCDSSFYVVLTSCDRVHGMYTIRDPTGCYDKTGTIHAYDVKWYVMFR